MKRIAVGLVVTQLLATDVVTAQTAEDMVIAVSAHQTRTSGAEDAPGSRDGGRIGAGWGMSNG